MRLALTAALAIAMSATCFAVDKDGDKNLPKVDAGKPADASTTAPTKAVNTVCPVDGMKVDPKIAPVECKTKDGKTVMVGCCSTACVGKVKDKPDTYAEAAISNRQWKADEKVK